MVKKARTTQEELHMEVDIEKITPNPYQPESRRQVDDETAKQFGLSILEHGLLQKPLCRFGKDKFEMGDGWLRLCGQRWLVTNGHPEFQKMPVIIRELSDQQMADLVIETNLVRQDLNPIEEAKLYQRYLDDFKITQEELARRHNISQGELANRIRLLDLPEAIQGKVISKEIPPTHARYLLQLKTMPGEVEKLAKDTAERGLTVNQVDTEVKRRIWNKSEPLQPSRSYTPKPSFDIKQCETCEHNQVLTDPYDSKLKEPRCLNPDCWHEKEKAAIASQQKERVEELKKQGIAKIYSRDELKTDQYESLDDWRLKAIDNPKECQTCEKRAGLQYYHNELTIVCTDPKCFRQKQSKKSREENKKERETALKYEQSIDDLFSVVKVTDNQTLLASMECLLRATTGLDNFVRVYKLKTDDAKKQIRVDSVMKALGEKNHGELFTMLPRLCFEVLRTKFSYDNSLINRMLGEFKKAPSYQETKGKEVAMKDSRKLLPASAREPITALDRQLEKEAIAAEKQAKGEAEKIVEEDKNGS